MTLVLRHEGLKFDLQKPLPCGRRTLIILLLSNDLAIDALKFRLEFFEPLLIPVQILVQRGEHCLRRTIRMNFSPECLYASTELAGECRTLGPRLSRHLTGGRLDDLLLLGGISGYFCFFH